MSTYQDILIEARKKIERKQENYVCLAISAVRTLENAHACDQLKKWILKILGGADTYVEWLQINHRDQCQVMTWNDIRAGRLAWLDWMIPNVDREISK